MKRLALAVAVLCAWPSVGSADDYVEALIGWWKCLQVEVDAMALSDVAPEDVATAALGNCRSTEATFHKAVEHDPVRSDPAGRLLTMRDGFRQAIVTRVVNIRVHGSPEPKKPE